MATVRDTTEADAAAPAPVVPADAAAPAPIVPAPATAAAPIAVPVTHVAASATPVIAPATSAAPDTPPSTTRWWALALLLVVGVWWLSWRRSRLLAQETRRLARQHRALQSANSRLQNESQQLRQRATNDPLTGVLNRQAFAAGLRELVEHLAHYDRPVSLIVFDLDHFKTINDRLGHLAGDSALKLVVGIVREHLVSADLFGRFGGDEFLIACADQTPASAALLAETIRAAVEAAAPVHSPALPGLTLSMGVAETDADTGYSADALFARADAALYEAKRRGRNRVVVADGTLAQAPAAAAAARHL